MRLVLDDDQRMLERPAREFAASTRGVSRLRTMRDTDDPLGFSVEVWRKIAELGWTAIPFPEEHGGLNLGLAEAVVVTEALGRELSPEPYIGTVFLAGGVLLRAGTAAQRERLLAPLIAGKRHVALAYAERDMRFDLRPIATRAEKRGSGFVIDGTKEQVLGGPGAEDFVVAARTSGDAGGAGGLSLFVLPSGTAGLEVVRQQRVDGASVARLTLSKVEIPASSLVGELDRGAEPLEQSIDAATVALSGEMLGSMSEAFDRTLRYLKERVQFDVVIGSFQALKHRAARMFIEIELTRSAVMAAARAVDEGAPEARQLVSVAKARASDAFLLVANEAIQMHGGIGMTDEHDIGFFLKRARAAEQTFGDAAYHRDRYARAIGF
jgi:acyl-CoA dehydrogenase